MVMVMVMRTIAMIIPDRPLPGAEALSRLLQLASPMLPVGAYAYSQGLETAIETGQVGDAEEAAIWIGDVLNIFLARFELPLLWRMRRAWDGDGTDLAHWNALFCAGRDSAEGRAETLQMGYSLVRLIADLGAGDAAALTRLQSIEPVSYPLAYAFLSAQWGIPAAASVQAYGWSWLENQVAVAMKAIPIGQAAAQRILFALSAALPDAVADAMALPDDELSNFAPGLTLAAYGHETQYSRLFRS
jgi:urease accessory protein